MIRGDKNPNTNGLLAAFNKYGISTSWTDLESKLNSKQIKHLVEFGPENTVVYKDIEAKVNLFSKATHLAYFTSAKVDFLKQSKNVQVGSVVIPLKTFVEKTGSFTNHAGLVQTFKKATTIVSDALNVNEVAQLLDGQEIQIPFVPAENLFVAENLRPDQVRLEHRKKNEFLFTKG